jgi:hypothetical protein
MVIDLRLAGYDVVSNEIFGHLDGQQLLEAGRSAAFGKGVSTKSDERPLYPSAA